MPRPKKASLAAAVLALLTTAACSGAKPPPAAPSPSPEAACAPGAFRDSTGLYCIVVPQGYTSTGATTTADGVATDQWNDAKGNAFRVQRWAADRPGHTLPDELATFTSTLTGMHVQERKDIAGGGQYQRYHNPDINRYAMRSVTRLGDQVVECQAVYDGILTPNDACRTLLRQ